jgi:hypothetical protein
MGIAARQMLAHVSTWSSRGAKALTVVEFFTKIFKRFAVR